MNTNIYKKFRAVEKLANRYSLSKRFDEPTYFSFRLIFGHNNDDVYNIANNSALYDTMPHPLFDLGLTSVTLPGIPRFGSLEPAPSQPIITTEPNSYSALQYLVESNEPTRAAMLQEFIQKFNQLQNDFPYYFQAIEGISDLLKIDHKRGQRINNDTILTITCLEGLDLRMSYLMNLYRKIAWDDVYQRWVLPDMMRYFTLKIYLAEFRTFHIAQTSSQPGGGLGDIPVAGNTLPYPYTAQTQGNLPMYLSVLDDILPTWEITCEMCEFDIANLEYDHINNLNVGDDPNQGQVKFGIKVGNIKELQIYPMFVHKYLSDRKINGLNRSKEDEISTFENSNNRYLYPISLKIAQAREKQVFDDSHVSGLPFNEMRNNNTMFGQGGPGADNNWGSPDDDVQRFSATQPSTWVGNAINFGTAYAKNFVNQYIDKGKITTIPGLGVSFNEVKAALETKNVVGALGLIRKGINEVTNQFADAPSSRLDQNIQTDRVMREFLGTLSRSNATDEDSKLLTDAANMALSDRGIWEKIRDFSMATDLTGTGEVNIGGKIEGAQDYMNAIQQSNRENGLSISESLQQTDFNAVSGNIDENQIDTGVPSSLLPGSIQDNVDQGLASELIGNSAGDGLNMPQSSERLGQNTEGDGLPKIGASEYLKNQSEGSGLKTTKPSSLLSSSVQRGDLPKSDPNIRTTTIKVSEIMESSPSSINNEIEGKPLKQPKPSKATNSKLEQ